MTKKIAWGTSKLLEMYLENSQTNPFNYCVDGFSQDDTFCGLEVKSPNSILEEKESDFQVIIFAASNKSLQEISLELNKMGLSYKKDYIYYSDFFYDSFHKKIKEDLGITLNNETFKFVHTFNLNSYVPVHTTILGNWLILNLLDELNDIDGSIAEIGAYRCGNVLCYMQYMNKMKPKKYYVLDSFEGFCSPSEHDIVEKIKKIDFSIEVPFQNILDTFVNYPNVEIIKGFVPDTFEKIDPNEKFSLVFYDCDLYQPAKDTFKFFWDKIVHGGYLLIHDYESEKNGYIGVKKATDEYFGDKDVKIYSYFENTTAVIRKP